VFQPKSGLVYTYTMDTIYSKRIQSRTKKI